MIEGATVNGVKVGAAAISSGDRARAASTSAFGAGIWTVSPDRHGHEREEGGAQRAPGRASMCHGDDPPFEGSGLFSERGEAEGHAGRAGGNRDQAVAVRSGVGPAAQHAAVAVDLHRFQRTLVDEAAQHAL